MRHYCPYTPFILVGTKLDLLSNFPTAIRTKQGMDLAKKLGAIKFLECSALTQSGLKSVFDEAIKIGINPPPIMPRKKSCTFL